MTYQPPPILEAFVCNCTQPEKVGYSSLHPDNQHWVSMVYKLGMTIDERIQRATPIGQFCNICKLTIGPTVENAVKFCDSCRKPYLPEPKPETYPITHFLCKKCDVPKFKLRRKQ